MIGRVGGSLAFVALTMAPAWPAAAVPVQQPAPPQRILLVGDSTADTMFPFLRDAAAARCIDVRSAARIGCSVIDGDSKLDDGRSYVDIYGGTSQCAAITSSQQNRLLATQRPDLVVWMSEWGEAWPNRVLDGQLVHFGTIPGNKAILAHIDSTVARLTAGGARVALLPAAPRAYPSVRGLPNAAGDARMVQLAKLLRAYARQRPDTVSLVDLPTILQCPTADRCPEEVAPGIRPRALDGFHFDGSGAAWLADQLVGMLAGTTPVPAPPGPAACGAASLGNGSAASRGAECA